MDEWTLNDLLECSVCLERLDTSSKVLPCQHTFCKKCLEEIVSTHKELRCPECRVLIDIKIEELPPNVLLMRILEGMRNAAPKKCGIGTPSRAQGGHFPQAAVQQMSPAVQHPVAPNTAMVQSLEITTRTPVTPKQTMTQPNQPYARAVYDYLSNEPGDLTFKKGDIIFLRKKIDTNWCQGECGGNQGVFPLTYVQVITPLPSHIPQCKALYDFRMTIDDEEGCLTFNKGEVITVIRRVDENWAEGKLSERIGIFPLAFVELNGVARALMKLSTNSQPGPSRVAPPTPTSEDTTPLIPTDHSRTVTNSQSSQHHHHHHHHHHNTPVVSTQTTHQGSTTTEHSHQHIILGTSDSSSTVSSASSSTTTPNTSSSNTSSSSSTAPSSPTSPAHAAQTPARPNHPVSPPHREKRHSFSVLPHTAHNNQTSHRHSAEILSPTNTTVSQEVPGEELLQRQGSQRHRRSGSSDWAGGHPPPPQGSHISPANMGHLPAAYIALYPYKPQKVDELELKKGCIYMVTERCQDGWFKGTSSRSQKSGVFPGNYVTPAKVQAQLRGSSRPASGGGPLQPLSSPRNTGTPPLEPRSYTRATGAVPLSYSPRQHTLTVGGGGQGPPELPPRSSSPNTSPHAATISASWHGQQQTSQPQASDLTSSAPVSLGRSHSAVMSGDSRPLHVSMAVTPPPNVAVTAANKSVDKTKEKKDKGSLMRRLTSMKKSKSPPPTTYSMDNPVFEDGTVAASPAHPVHVRSGSCPSQLLQVLPLEASTAHHRLFGSGSQRLKHKDRPTVVMANVTQCGRSNESGSASGSSTNHHRKSNSLDAGSCDPGRKANKPQTLPVRERFRCIVPYPPNSEYELELRVGDIIHVHKKREDGWYKGTQQRTGRTGLFPASFVESF